MHYLFLLCIGAIFSGCSMTRDVASSVANTVAKPETQLLIAPSVDINPDSNLRPSPLVIRVYELSAGNDFEASEFFGLYDNAEKVLGNHLISSVDIVVLPGKAHEHVMSLSPKTRYIGVMAEFRDIQNADWRLLAEADPRGYDTISIAIDSLTIRHVE
jgi:type VI secretion system protein VasD